MKKFTDIIKQSTENNRSTTGKFEILKMKLVNMLANVSNRKPIFESDLFLKKQKILQKVALNILKASDFISLKTVIADSLTVQDEKDLAKRRTYFCFFTRSEKTIMKSKMLINEYNAAESKPFINT